MEKIVIKRSLKDFCNRESPWKNRSYSERFNAMAVICQTHQKDGPTESEFSRVYKITRNRER
jgi:hypothetical protein